MACGTWDDADSSALSVDEDGAGALRSPPSGTIVTSDETVVGGTIGGSILVLILIVLIIGGGPIMITLRGLVGGSRCTPRVTGHNCGGLKNISLRCTGTPDIMQTRNQEFVVELKTVHVGPVVTIVRVPDLDLVRCRRETGINILTFLTNTARRVVGVDGGRRH